MRASGRAVEGGAEPPAAAMFVGFEVLGTQHLDQAIAGLEAEGGRLGVALVGG